MKQPQTSVMLFATLIIGWFSAAQAAGEDSCRDALVPMQWQSQLSHQQAQHLLYFLTEDEYNSASQNEGIRTSGTYGVISGMLEGERGSYNEKKARYFESVDFQSTSDLSRSVMLQTLTTAQVSEWGQCMNRQGGILACIIKPASDTIAFLKVIWKAPRDERARVKGVVNNGWFGDAASKETTYDAELAPSGQISVLVERSDEGQTVSFVANTDEAYECQALWPGARVFDDVKIESGKMTISLDQIRINRVGEPFPNPAFQCRAVLHAVEATGKRLLASDAGRESSIATGDDASFTVDNVWSGEWSVSKLDNVHFKLRVEAREDNDRWLDELSGAFVLPPPVRGQLLSGEPSSWEGSVAIGSQYKVTFVWQLQLRKSN